MTTPPLELSKYFSFLKSDQIIISEAERELASRSTLPTQTLPEILVYPENQAEVQQIVKTAQSLKIPLWYVSTGKNWGYGCRSAPYQGGITMILERMKKIYEVNADLGYAVIEPGVTYEDLSQYLEKNNIPLWTDAAGTTKSASIIGNALDKGRGLTPYADHYGMLCGMDIILPDGSFLESSLVSNFQCKHTYKWGIGPNIDGLFSQSNFGVVVKSGIWLMPKPERFDFFAFEYSAGAEAFPTFIEDFRKLFFSNGMLSRPHLANDFAMLCIVDRYPSEMLEPGKKCLSARALSEWKKKHGVMDWTFGGGLYGTAKQISAQRELVRRHLKPYGTLRFLGDGMRDGLWSKIFRKLVIFGARLSGKSPEFISQIFPAADLFRGKPTDEFAKQVYFKSEKSRPVGSFNPAVDNCGFIWTGPLVPFTSTHIEKCILSAKKVFAESEFDFFVELIVESPRTIIALFGVFFNPQNKEESDRALNWYKTIHKLMNDLGYSAYRETSMSTNEALNDNPALKKYLGTIKKATDPNAILAPGRYGISSDIGET